MVRQYTHQGQVICHALPRERALGPGQHVHHQPLSNTVLACFPTQAIHSHPCFVKKYSIPTLIDAGWRPSLLGWRPSQLGWRPSLLGWRPSLLVTRSFPLSLMQDSLHQEINPPNLQASQALAGACTALRTQVMWNNPAIKYMVSEKFSKKNSKASKNQEKNHPRRE